jgi:hypothetical protein
VGLRLLPRLNVYGLGAINSLVPTVDALLGRIQLSEHCLSVQAMEVQNGALHPRKRRRRRRLDRPAISARILLDDGIKGEVGVLSEDLFADLFPWAQSADKGR